MNLSDLPSLGGCYGSIRAVQCAANAARWLLRARFAARVEELAAPEGEEPAGNAEVLASVRAAPETSAHCAAEQEHSEGVQEARGLRSHSVCCATMSKK